MRPPICAICDKEFDPDAELVTFKATEESREFDRRVREEGIVGHPPNREWFCRKHVEIAKKMMELTRSEALSKIRENI